MPCASYDDIEPFKLEAQHLIKYLNCYLNVDHRMTTVWSPVYTMCRATVDFRYNNNRDA